MAIFFFFFTAALLAAFTSHYFLYLSLLRFFTWPTGNKFWLVAGLAVFAGGFIILLILGRFLNAIYLNWLYLIFAGWYGLLVYLLSASAIVLAIGRLAGLAPQSTALRNLAVVFFILAF